MAISLSSGSDGNSTGASVSSSDAVKDSDMVGACSVCLDDQGTDENPLVYCDGCDLAVHQACYGIVDVPSGRWFCRKCESQERSAKIRCELCPSKQGALKRTENNGWAHVVCALYIPEVRFGNNNTMEPIETRHIPPERYNRCCYLCEEKDNASKATYGACMHCNKLGCKQSFHVTCAQAAGLLCEEASQQVSENIVYCGYCRHHYKKLKPDTKKKIGGHINNLNNSSSNLSDSASDSSQDNESKCNTTEIDKNSSDHIMKHANNPTKSTSGDDSSPLKNHISSLTSVKTSASMSSTTTPISLKVPNSISNSRTSATTVPAQSKKKRGHKNSQSNAIDSVDSNPTLLIQADPRPLVDSVTTSSANDIQADTSNTLMKLATFDSHAATSKQETPSLSKSNSKKKSAQGALISPETKQGFSSLAPMTASNFSMKKLSSPNLSVSTSSTSSTSSQASPSSRSTSASSSSSSSTSSKSTSSSSTPFSNSPSPALASPNALIKLSINRTESPFPTSCNPPRSSSASAPSWRGSTKLQIDLDGQQDTSKQSTTTTVRMNSHLSPETASIDAQNRLNGSSNQSTSLLSTAAPIQLGLSNVSMAPATSLVTNVLSDSWPAPRENNISFPQSSKSAASLTFTSNNSNIVGPNNGNSIIAKESVASVSENNVPLNLQPRVPPLVISVNQTGSGATSIDTKNGTKVKPSAKVTRKKSSSDSSQKPVAEAKPKQSRSKKKDVNTGPATTAKPETKRSRTKKEPNNNNETTANNNIVPTNAKPETSTVPRNDSEMNPRSKDTTKSPAKRKARSASNESAANTTPSPTKRPRKKKNEVPANTNEPVITPGLVPAGTAIQLPPLSVPTSNVLPFSSTSGPLMIKAPLLNTRVPYSGQPEVLPGSDINNRFCSPLISPFMSIDNHSSATPQLSKTSLSRLFAPSTEGLTNQDDPTRAFEDLLDNQWSHLSKFVLDQAQQFDIPSLIGLLYTLRSENEKMVLKIRELASKREQLIALNARLDLPGPMLLQHLSSTSPNFSSVVSGLVNNGSAKSLASPGSGANLNKSPITSTGSYNQMPSNHMMPPNYIDRSSPLINQTHSGTNHVKSTSISTPSPPVSALMAHSNSNNRGGLNTVTSQYITSVYSTLNPMLQAGPTSQPQNFYPRP